MNEFQEVQNILLEALEKVKGLKTEERSAKQRVLAVAITELEKAIAYFSYWYHIA